MWSASNNNNHTHCCLRCAPRAMMRAFKNHHHFIWYRAPPIRPGGSGSSVLARSDHKFSGEKDAAYWSENSDGRSCCTQGGNGESGNANGMAGKETDSEHGALSPRHFRSNYRLWTGRLRKSRKKKSKPWES